MDIRCPKCGEPWDLDCIHERVSELNADADYDGTPHTTFDKVAADFRRRGCRALGDRCNAEALQTATRGGLASAEAAATLYELLGDDMDGAAAMLEDLGF